MNLELGQKVYHTDMYNGKEEFTIIGIREHEVELQGDFSGGTHNVVQSGWFSSEGIRISKQENEVVRRPPLGLTPRWFREEKVTKQRINEIKEALMRYLETKSDCIDIEWVEEYNELVSKLEQKGNEKNKTPESTASTDRCVEFAGWIRTFGALKRYNETWVLERQISDEELYQGFLRDTKEAKKQS